MLPDETMRFANVFLDYDGGLWHKQTRYYIMRVRLLSLSVRRIDRSWDFSWALLTALKKYTGLPDVFDLKQARKAYMFTFRALAFKSQGLSCMSSLEKNHV